MSVQLDKGIFPLRLVGMYLDVGKQRLHILYDQTMNIIPVEYLAYSDPFRTPIPIIFGQ